MLTCQCIVLPIELPMMLIKRPIDKKKDKEFDPERQIQTKERFQFKWDTQSKDIITTHISRSIRSTINEKRTIDGLDT